MNLDGKLVPGPHPGWGVCAEELMFYTSRYAVYIAYRLRELGADLDCCISGFHAYAMSPAQRTCMARLLAFAPDPVVARAVAALISAVATGRPPVPKNVRRIARKCRTAPKAPILPSRPRNSTGLADVDPTDVLQHLGRRYGFPVVITGHQVWLNDARCSRLLSRKRTREAINFCEVIEALQRRNFELHLPIKQRYPSAAQTAHSRFDPHKRID